MSMKSTILGGLVLFGVSDAVAQIAGQTGTVPGFPQFYESSIERECDGQRPCDVGFGLVPGSSLFMAANIMCHVFVNFDLPIGTRGKFTLREQQSGEVTLKNVFYAADDSPPSGVARREYILHESLLAFFAPGSRPIISFSSGILPRPAVVECKLAGNLVRGQ